MKYNGKKVTHSFEQFCKMFTDHPLVFGKFGKRWQIAIGLTPNDQHSQVSFVNAINTSRGGVHVNYITDQVVKFVLAK